MKARLVVVRPEPGNAATAAAARAAGWTVDALPLFAVAPIAWTSPRSSAFDALLLTSANAARHGGDGMLALGLPVVAIGEATAAAARAAGLQVVLTGEGDGDDIAARARRRGYRRLLHLAGRDRRALAVEQSIAVYASDALPPPGDAAERLRGTVLLHSARAAARVAALAKDRDATAIVAISAAVLAAAGPGWRAALAASEPADAALLAAAATLGDSTARD